MQLWAANNACTSQAKGKSLKIVESSETIMATYMLLLLQK